MAHRIPSGSAVGTGLPACTRRASARLKGFSFVELMVVISIIVILIRLAIPIYSKTVLRSKESVLASNLFTLRTTIQNYTADKQRAPQRLEDLVAEGYLLEVPMDPITGSRTTWRVIMEQPGQSVNESETGIFNVKSGSDKTGLDGIPYAEK